MYCVFILRFFRSNLFRSNLCGSNMSWREPNYCRLCFFCVCINNLFYAQNLWVSLLYMGGFCLCNLAPVRKSSQPLWKEPLLFVHVQSMIQQSGHRWDYLCQPISLSHSNSMIFRTSEKHFSIAKIKDDYEKGSNTLRVYTGCQIYYSWCLLRAGRDIIKQKLTSWSRGQPEMCSMLSPKNPSAVNDTNIDVQILFIIKPPIMGAREIVSMGNIRPPCLTRLSVPEDPA